MGKKYFTLWLIIIISGMLLITFQSRVYSASASISASSQKVEKGEKVSIKVNINQSAAWNLDATESGGNLSKSDNRVGSADSGNNENKTVEIGTFSASEPGEYTITLSGNVVDGTNLSKVDVSRTKN